MVKSVAAKRGLKLEKHGALWHFVNTLAKESGDKDLVRFFHVANDLIYTKTFMKCLKRP